ncbi:MAG: hypothetical protein PHP64_04045 [Actinomycetota bacterium]|nr:hypothetical protein [Actinomycetota bacterium]
MASVVGVTSIKMTEGEFEISTTSPQEALMGIFALAQQKGAKVTNVNMKKASLEDVFLRITGRRIRS